MSAAEEVSSGKTSRGENFPVASTLIARPYRAPILAFYRFARAADDVADHATLTQERKFELLAQLEATLLGTSDADAAALPLRAEIAARALPATHALELLTAFRLDVSKRRYADWNELMDYCRYSAMPVGRFVLDVHGESRATWPASDALCTALQVINHLQDCSKDYRALDRVYLPLDVMDRYGVVPNALAAKRASPGLRACLSALAARTEALLPEAARLPLLVSNARLGVETAVIVALARKLTSWLIVRDPLSERVHATRSETLAVALRAIAAALVGRRLRRTATPAPGSAR